MKTVTRFMSAMGLAIAAVAALAVPANAATRGIRHSGSEQVVFVQNDSVTGNQIVAYDRAEDGTLTQAGTYATGGLGGVLTGSVVDHLASQAH